LSQLSKNLDLLSRRHPELARRLISVPAGHVEVFPSASGVATAQWLQGARKVPLHSRYDPVKEARASILKQDVAGADYFVLLGFGLGYLLEALIEISPDPANRYFIVESDLELLRAAFEARDLQHILSLPYVHFAWPPSGMELAAQWRRFFDPVKAQKSVFVSHPPSCSLAPELFKAAVDAIQSETFQIYTDINTLVGQSRSFLENFVKNLPWAASSPGIAHFAGQFARTPAVVVSAGPSLDKNIQDLRGCEDRCLILATDTAVKPLLAAGIEPHFVLSADPSYKNFLHLKGALLSAALLVTEATAYPAVFTEFAGRTISCTYKDSSLRSLSDLMADKGTLTVWGSVATMAMSFALVLGCDPVIFMGQDLAHSDGRIYCTGLYFEHEWFPGHITAEQWQKKWETLRKGKQTIMMEDVFGRPVETTDKLAAYWNWMVKEIRSHPEILFVNATEGGILREGVEVISLRDALQRYARHDRQLRERVKERFDGSTCRNKAPNNRLVESLQAEARLVAEVLEQGIAYCVQTESAPAHPSRPVLEELKESIYTSAPHLSQMIDCFNQMGNVAFLRNRASLGPSAPASAILSTYREYFETVHRALDEITPALNEIQGTLRQQVS